MSFNLTVFQVNAIRRILGPCGHFFNQRMVARLFEIAQSTVHYYSKLGDGITPKAKGVQRLLSNGDELTLLAQVLSRRFNNEALAKNDIIEMVCSNISAVSFFDENRRRSFTVPPTLIVLR